MESGFTTIIVLAAIIVIVVIALKYIKKSRAQDQIKSAEQMAISKQQTQQYFDELYQNQTLPEIQVSLSLKVGEKACLHEDNAVLMEERTKRVSNRGGGAVRIAKGLYLGGSQSVSRSFPELTNIDRGELTLTNKRIIFNGAMNTKEFRLEKIIELEELSDGISIAYEGKSKKSIFALSPGRGCWKLFLDWQRKLDRGEEIPRVTIQ